MRPRNTTQNRKTLPNCVVVGPQKAGNSWIDVYLRTRDDVGVSEGVTELFFFDRHYRRGIDWYAKHFANGADKKTIVEVAPTYFHSQHAPDRILQDLGTVRIVCTLRHPAKRAFSLYLHLRRYGLTRARCFREAFEREPCIQESSCYATHVSRWLDAVGRDNVLVLFLESLAADNAQYVGQLCDHLGIPVRDIPSSLNRRVNAAALPFSGTLAQVGLYAVDTLRSLGMYRVIETAKRLGLKRFFFGSPSSSELPRLSKENEVWFAAQMAEEIDALERLLQTDLSHWKSAAESTETKVASQDAPSRAA